MNKQHAVKATLAALALAVTLTASGCGGTSNAGGMSGMDHNSASPMMSHTPSAEATSSPAMPSPSPSTSAPFNAADAMFVQMMLPHHKQAVAMSDTLMKKSGVSAQTTALAGQIKAAQQPEITSMDGWLKAWGQDPMGHSMGGMDMGGGMATDAELGKFDKAKGIDAEKMYLKMMTAHHRGAIKMAHTEIKNGRNSNAVALAKRIAASQQKEIVTMKKLLAQM